MKVVRTKAFQKKVYGYYAHKGRVFSWRGTQDPYLIVVSEIMLQQTQVSRVEKKFEEFTKAFPSFQKLADAPQKEVLKKWQGLGYNRRALALHQIAKIVTNTYHGVLPKDPKVLETLPGIGKATASSIVVFAFNKPEVFIETNIRSVFIHEFFKDKKGVDDKELLPLIKSTLDTKNPRRWYFALMDYGVMLKKEYKNPSKKSFHYKKQSPFITSNRRVRGLIIKKFTEGVFDGKSFMKEFGIKKVVLSSNLKTLEKEGFLNLKKGKYVFA